MSENKFVIQPGFFNLGKFFVLIEGEQDVIKKSESSIDVLCKTMAPVIQGNLFKKGVSSEMDQLFFLKELKRGTSDEEDLEFTGSNLFQAVIKKSVLRSLTNQRPAPFLYYVHVPQDHPYRSKTNDVLGELISNISKETELSNFCFELSDRSKLHTLCISAIYHYDKVAQ